MLEQIEAANKSTINKMILIADDNIALREAYCETLEPLGYPVITAANGSDALKQYQAHRDKIALVILDINMPLISGDEVCRQMMATNPKTGVIIVSSDSEEMVKERLKDVPSVPFLRKPFSLMALLNQVGAVLAASS